MREFGFALGKLRFQDKDKGDCGSFCKKSRHYPYVDYVRSNWCGRHQNSILHQDVGPVGGNTK